MQSTAPSTTIVDFYKGDIVEIAPEFYTEWLPAADRTFFVHSTNEDGSTVTGVKHATNSSLIYHDFAPAEVKLKSRGNLFKHQFGTAPVSFRDLSEETQFWIELNQADQVKNPATNMYFGWTAEQAYDALKRGIVDAVFLKQTHQQTPFRSNHVVDSAYRFKDRQVAGRIRTMMLKRSNRLIPRG
jgi:hypothetical protein